MDDLAARSVEAGGLRGAAADPVVRPSAGRGRPAVESSPIAELVRALRWRWAPAAALAALFALGAAVYAESLPAEYDAVAVVSVEPRSLVGVDDETIDRLVPKYAALATAEPTERRVARELGSAGEAEVRADAVFESGLVQITVRDRSPDAAARRANAVARELVRFSLGDRNLTARVVASAAVPTEAAAPQRRAIEAAGLVAGLLVSASLFLLLERLRPRVRSVDDAAAAAGYAFLGGASWRAGEPVHAVRAALERRLPADARVLAVVPAVGREAQTVAGPLAHALAGTGKSVLLVDVVGDGGDGRLGDVLAGEAELGEAVRVDAGHRLASLTAGGRPDGDLLARGLPQLVERARAAYDLTVAAAPPVSRDPAGATVVAAADATVLCVGAHTEAGAVRDAARALDAVGVPVTGFVAVGFDLR